MKKRPEDNLLGDIFSKSSDFRAASLEQMLFSARRKRQRRKVVQVSGIAMLVMGLFVLNMKSRNRVESSAPQVASINSSSPIQKNFPTVPGTSIRILNDEELLEMFKGRPVALMGPPEDRRFVVLDELRKEKASEAVN